MNVLIDTNVALDYFLKREGFAENAKRWFYEAATKGHIGAGFQLGKMRFFGWSIPVNRGQGEQWIRWAAQRGDKNAIDFLKDNANLFDR